MCIHRDGAQAGVVEMWNSTAQVKLGEMLHPGVKDHLLLEETGQLATASPDGLVKIWDLDSARCAAEFEVQNFAFLSAAQKGVLSITTRTETPDGPSYGHTYRTLGGKAIPELLEENLSDADYWIAFSDGVHVVGTSTPIDHAGRRDCRFKILGADGTPQGAFSHASVKEIVPFLDQFIVTAALAGDLKIWSKTGEELSSHGLGYSYPTIVSDDHERLIAFSSFEASLYEATQFDFGAPRTEIQNDTAAEHSSDHP